MFIRIYLLGFLLHFTRSDVNRKLKITSGMEPIARDSVAMRFYIDVNNSGEDCLVECAPDRCCLKIDGKYDCKLLQVYGGGIEFVPRDSSKIFRFAVPLINPFERKGHCIVYVDSKPEGREVMRDTVKFTFDTSLKNYESKTRHCKRIDEDPFNDCKPVDCDTYYNGQRPYFDKKLKRCVEVPSCLSSDREMPDVVYDPKANRCRKNVNITSDDLEYVKSLTNAGRSAKNIIIIKTKSTKRVNATRSNPSLTNAKVDEDLFKSFAVEGKTNNVPVKKAKGEKCKTNAVKNYFIKHRDMFTMLAIITCIQCCLICIMSSCLGRSCNCHKDKALVSSFFNYRQDVSVTTPLIKTSNDETETTFQYLSESSSNIDRKIKCYKACHKEKPHNAKFSMSDDILSKCLTRRDWTRKPKSDTINEARAENWDDLKEPDKAKKSETKVNFENVVAKTKSDTKPNVVKSIVKKKDDNLDVHPSSEQEVTCFNYEEKDKDSRHNATGRTVSISTEKSAQACFSNDSIDDFLSERGMIFLAGENISKYSFSSDATSNQKRSCSELSGKTSKNNIIKNVLSLMHRQALKGPSSDPGGSRADNLDLELLHMSQASVFSSTNESESANGLKKAVESRTSL